MQPVSELSIDLNHKTKVFIYILQLDDKESEIKAALYKKVPLPIGNLKIICNPYEIRPLAEVMIILGGRRRSTEGPIKEISNLFDQLKHLIKNWQWDIGVINEKLIIHLH